MNLHRIEGALWKLGWHVYNVTTERDSERWESLSGEQGVIQGPIRLTINCDWIGDDPKWVEAQGPEPEEVEKAKRTLSEWLGSETPATTSNGSWTAGTSSKNSPAKLSDSKKKPKLGSKIRRSLWQV